VSLKAIIPRLLFPVKNHGNNYVSADSYKSHIKLKNGYKMNVENTTDHTSLFQRKSEVL
jgi:hypothetical protein